MALTRAARKACLRRLKPHNELTRWSIPSSSPIRMPTTIWRADIPAGVTAAAILAEVTPEAAIPVEDATRVVVTRVEDIPGAVIPAVVAEAAVAAVHIVTPMAKR